MTELLASVISLRWLRQGMIALGVVIIVSLVYSVFDPAPDAVLPEESLFEVQPLWPLVAAGTKAAETDAFVRRPLFAKTRRPPPQPKPQPESQPEVVEAEPIEGVELVGIFGSGDVAGAILRLEDGVRMRLKLGERVKGWRLDGIDTRKASLVSSNGRERSVLEMKFAEIKPLPIQKVRSKRSAEPAVRADPSVDSGEAGADDAAESGQTDSKPEPDMSTFGGMYQQIRQDAEQNAEETDG